MKRTLWICFAVGSLSVVVMGLLLGATGCGGGEEPAAETSSSTVESAPVEATPPAEAPEAAPEEPPVAEPETPASEPAETPVDVTAPEESVAPEAAQTSEPESSEQPVVLLTWERQNGAGDHCDRMTIYPDGRIVAVRCSSGTDLDSTETTLTVEAAAQLHEWADRFAPFSRRESDVTRAVMSTVFEGRGDAEPTTAEKEAVTSFVKGLFLALMMPSES